MSEPGLTTLGKTFIQTPLNCKPVYCPQNKLSPDVFAIIEKQIKKWLALDGGNFDIVHFNFGLHDIKRVESDGRPSDDPDDPSQADPATYARQLRHIVESIQASGATPIFATTTPVPAGKVRPHRERADVDRYNQIARQIMAEYEISINDLNRFAAPKLDTLQRPVNVHFTPEGSQALGERVTESIRDALSRKSQ